jgi:hypothetical protein
MAERISNIYAIPGIKEAESICRLVKVLLKIYLLL